MPILLTEIANELSFPTEADCSTHCFSCVRAEAAPDSKLPNSTRIYHPGIIVAFSCRQWRQRSQQKGSAEWSEIHHDLLP
jgi:hypothetical protein